MSKKQQTVRSTNNGQAARTAAKIETMETKIVDSIDRLFFARDLKEDRAYRQRQARLAARLK